MVNVTMAITGNHLVADATSKWMQWIYEYPLVNIQKAIENGHL